MDHKKNLGRDSRRDFSEKMKSISAYPCDCGAVKEFNERYCNICKHQEEKNNGSDVVRDPLLTCLRNSGNADI